MYQSMSLLQMGIEELEAYMHELSLENPLIDEKPRKADSYKFRLRENSDAQRTES